MKTSLDSIPSQTALRARTAIFLTIALMLFGDGSGWAAMAAGANDFLNSIGVCTHMTQKVDRPADVVSSLVFIGIRNIRDDGSTSPPLLQNFIDVHHACGVKVSLLPINGDIARSLFEWEQLAAAGALLCAEGPNEPNNGPVNYNGELSGAKTNFLPVAAFQRDLYAAVKSDPKLAGIPVFASSEAGGSEPNNVGLQFLTIPSGAATLMPDGTAYADFANPHNYVCARLPHVVDNNAWNAEDPTLKSSWDGLYVEYGHTWRRGFEGYSPAQLERLPRVTTETGWITKGKNALTEDQQGKLFLNLYLDAFSRGWSHTFIYMLRDDPHQGYWGLVHTDYTPKLSATYLHNLTTILADNTSVTPGSLDYSIMEKPATVHDMLLQKSNGSFELAVWDEKVAGSDQLTVKLGATYGAVKVYDPTLGIAPVQTLSSVNSVPLTLSDHPLIIELPKTPGSG